MTNLLKVQYHRKITIIKPKKYNNYKIQSISFLEIYIKILGVSLAEGKLPTDKMKSKKYARTGKHVDEKSVPVGCKGAHASNLSSHLLGDRVSGDRSSRREAWKGLEAAPSRGLEATHEAH